MFEMVSGFTTTGSTSLSNVEALPKGLLFWRASTHWLGGVGVVMFVLVVLPSMGSTKMRLSSVELSSMAKHNYHYKATMIAQILLFTLGLAVLDAIIKQTAFLESFSLSNFLWNLASGCILYAVLGGMGWLIGWLLHYAKESTHENKE